MQIRSEAGLSWRVIGTYCQGKLERRERIGRLPLFLHCFNESTVLGDCLLLRAACHDHADTRKALTCNARCLPIQLSLASLALHSEWKQSTDDKDDDDKSCQRDQR